MQLKITFDTSGGITLQTANSAVHHVNATLAAQDAIRLANEEDNSVMFETESEAENTVIMFDSLQDLQQHAVEIKKHDWTDEEFPNSRAQRIFWDGICKLPPVGAN